MKACFDEKNNFLGFDKIKYNKSFIIGKDIDWEIIIRRNGKILEINKNELQANDLIIKNLFEIDGYEIKRNNKNKTIKKEFLFDNDKIEEINYKKKIKKNIIGYKICRGGEILQIKTKDMLSNDIIEHEFNREEITLNNNEIIFKRS